MSSFLCVRPLLLLLLLVLCCFTLIPSISSLHFVLTEGSSRCFLEEVPEDLLVVGRYRNIDWSSLVALSSSSSDRLITHNEALQNPERPNVVITVFSPMKEILLTHQLQEQGRFGFTSVLGGEYSICVSTNSQPATPERAAKFRIELAFDLNDYEYSHQFNGAWGAGGAMNAGTGDVAEGEGEDKLAQTEHFSAIQVELLKLNNKLKNIRNEQEYTKKREAKHRNTAEEMNSRVLWFGIFQMMIVVSGAAFSYFNLRKFFKSKKIA